MTLQTSSSHLSPPTNEYAHTCKQAPPTINHTQVCNNRNTYKGTGLLLKFIYLQIGTNGIFSFSAPFYSAVAVAFPSSLSTVANAYLVAPYWDDVDIRLAGNISYEVHSRSSNNPGSNQLLDQISQFIEDSIGESFQGDWMLIAEWEEVHPWPHGLHLSSPIWELFFPELVLVSM